MATKKLASTKVKAPWDPESIVFGEDNGSIAEHVRTNAPWEYYSQTSTENRAAMERKILAESYKFSTPWNKTEDEILDEFDKQLEVMDNHIVEPWNDATKGGINPVSATQAQKIENYKYEALWEPPPVDPKRVEMIKNFKTEQNCPFLRDDNLIPEDEKTKKKKEMLASKIIPTIPPWIQGAQPAAANTKQVVPKKVTSLWNVPPPAPKQYPFEPSNDPILDQLRLELYNRGSIGIFGLSRKFKIMDDDSSGTLDQAEFKKALRELNFKDMTDKAMGHLFRYFDRDDSGSISYNEFLVGVRGQLNARRLNMVKMAFKIMDTDNSGFIDVNDLKGVYNCRFHPDFINNRRTEEDILMEFLSAFEGRGRKNKDFKINLDEFTEYYSNLSASIDSDDYFELMIRNSWHISGGEGWSANTSNKRVLVTNSDGNQSVLEVRNDLKILGQASDKSGKSKEQLMNDLIAKQFLSEGRDIVGIDTLGNTTQGKGVRGLSDTILASNIKPLPTLAQPSPSNASSRGLSGLQVITNNVSSGSNLPGLGSARRPSIGSSGRR